MCWRWTLFLSKYKSCFCAIIFIYILWHFNNRFLFFFPFAASFNRIGNYLHQNYLHSILTKIPVCESCRFQIVFHLQIDIVWIFSLTRKYSTKEPLTSQATQHRSISTPEESIDLLSIWTTSKFETNYSNIRSSTKAINLAYFAFLIQKFYSTVNLTTFCVWTTNFKFFFWKEFQKKRNNECIE